MALNATNGRKVKKAEGDGEVFNGCRGRIEKVFYYLLCEEHQHTPDHVLAHNGAGLHQLRRCKLIRKSIDGSL